MMFESIQYHVKGPVAQVAIDRPAQRNALSNEVLAELRGGLALARADRAVRVVVLTGTGDRAFCAGGDLKGMKADPRSTEGHDARGELMWLFRDLWELGKPTIARVQGHALAGGFGLAMACDFVVASDRATFGLPEVDVGLWAFMVTVPLLHVVAPRVALDLLLTGRRLSATEAADLGLVRAVVTPDRLDQEVDELALTLASKAPTAVRLGRDALYAVCDSHRDLSLRYLHAMLSVALGSDDAAEGLAAFQEGRPPAWRTA